jgi:hypothetical protein
MVKEVKHIYLSDLHFDHKLWLNQLSFCEDELEIFNARLGELIKRNNTTDFAGSAESLQNRIIRQNEVVDELKHEIKSHEKSLATFAEEHPIAVDHVYFSDHTDLRAKMEVFVKLYDEFKNEFSRFSAKWL